ncbi:MAG: hypothetical protein JWM93_3307 [Frankiales bacterium]|nr:hypothetical protein [Frankiales bacterium]
MLSAAAILLSAMDCRLEALGPTGSPLEPLTHDRERDEARRHFPAHVDLRSTEHWGSWWLDRAPIGEFMRRPDWTFDRPAIPPFEDWLTAE